MTDAEKAAQEAEAAAQAAAAAAQAAASQTPAPTTKDPKVLEAELDRARKEAASYRVKLRAAEEAKRLESEKALAEQGKFKELAESRAKEIEAMKSELEPLRSVAATHQQRDAEEKANREAQVAADFAALPDDVRADIPDDADLRTKELIVRTHQKAAAGQKPRPPTLQSTAPRPATSDTKPPYTADQISTFNQIVANTRLPAAKQQEARAALAKAAAWRAEHPS